MPKSRWTVAPAGIPLMLSLVLSPALATAAPLGAASSEQVSAATASYLEGMDAFNQNEIERALAAFEKSYAAVASPNSHLMIARCLVRLERLVDAELVLEETLAEADAAAKNDAKYAATHAAAEEEQNDLHGKLAWLKLELDSAAPADTIDLGGRKLAPADTSKAQPAQPGSVHVRWMRGDRVLAEQDVTVNASEERTVSLSEPKAAAAPPASIDGEDRSESAPPVDEPASDPHRRTYAYVAAGVGVVGLASFVVFGLLDNGKHSTLGDDCRGNVCAHSLADDASSGRTLQGLANAGLIIGVVGLGTAAGLYFTSSPTSDASAQEAASVELAIHGRGVSVAGRF